MSQTPPPTDPPLPAMAYHLRLVAKLALSAGIVSGLALAAVILYLTQNGGDTYLDLTRGFANARRMLFPALLVSGLLLTLGAALVTWAVSLYSTARVAGPLFRFSQDLERVMDEGPVALDPLRQGDLFRDEFQEFSQAVHTLQHYYDDLSEQVDLARVRLEQPGEDFARTLERMRELERRAKL